MNEYRPDVWVIVEISGTKVPEPYRRVLAGWYGGYAGSNSWKLSSGVEDMIDRGTHWEIPNTSGSVYLCGKENERFSGLTAGIYSSYTAQNNEEFSMNHIPIGKEECDTGP